MFAFRSKYIPALNLFAAKKDIRHYLQGYLVEPHPSKGVLLKATNGHIAVIIHDEDGVCEGRHIIRANADMVRNSRRVANDIGDRWATHNGEDGGRIIIYDALNGEKLNPRDFKGVERWASTNEPLIHGVNYPELNRVIPKTDDLELGSTATINSIYLETLRKAMTALGGRGCDRSLTAWSQRDTKDGAVIFQLGRHDEVVAIVMPIFQDNPTAPEMELFRSAEKDQKEVAA